jgi:hypothetical protein
MSYIKDESGYLNNFAREPKMYSAEPMDNSQKRSRYILFGGAAVLVLGLIAVAVSIS